ncbi:MAG: lasso peptide biosynthesis protein [Methylocella sp.]|nr:MAG: hypothetical protein DLM68_16725 [Hyphomicrobiales bacterium]
MPLRRKLWTFLGMSSAGRLWVCEADPGAGSGQADRPYGSLSSDGAGAFARARDRRLRRGIVVGGAHDGKNSGAQCAVERGVPPAGMAAKAMLARRDCGSSFDLGAEFSAQGQLTAHSWLVAGGTIVVDAAGIGSVTPLARFG